ncbi:hypothetical protein HanXRQr2_Chr03g0094761 [Helianthus annuus]|uniref:Uncharacterized protein n=1 Tax=Helianthus annuus TaxID=4232 RepID=A0A9K3NU01_HELAN|nr:hypothetical protein HanXRQr2_Chr03g0094761 [Helianthus annuus]KAJ0942388.1 hypothetical protein HanPSC8_Chr03g0091351 [Helianthus annuus]
MQMKVSVTSTMFTNITYKLSNGVCEFWTECSQETLYLSVTKTRAPTSYDRK